MFHSQFTHDNAYTWFMLVLNFLCTHNCDNWIFISVSLPLTWVAWIWLQLLVSQLEPLTEQQLLGITNLQESSQQAEDALSQGMEALQQSLAETLSTGSQNSSGSSGNVANYMGQMVMAMGKLGTLEGFIRQVNFSYSNLCANNLVHIFSE